MGKSRQKKKARSAARSTPTPRPSLVVRTRAFIMGLVPVLAIVVGTRQLLAEAFRIPSGSMEPTTAAQITMHVTVTDTVIASPSAA